MKTKVFIDGAQGTTGLRIQGRLESRDDLLVTVLPDDVRKDPQARKAALNECDIAILCLPDAGSIEAVSFIENDSVRVIDASTAHRTAGSMGSPSSMQMASSSSPEQSALRCRAAMPADSSQRSFRLSRQAS